ncbi:MAG: SDR family NAD(P)-dependent oxidoreductase [Saccharospirillum sp.]
MKQPLAVITGASSGLGAAFARALAAKGYHLLLTGRREDRLQALCRQLAQRFSITCEYRCGDLSVAETRQALVQEITLLPRLDALVNNAGYAEDGRFGDIDWSRHQALLDVHVLATTQLTHAALPNLLSHQGIVINVASVASWMPTPQSALYGPTKAFVRSFSESLALAYHHTGLKVLGLCPGFTVTDFHTKLGLNPDEFYRNRGLIRAWSADSVVEQAFRDLAKGRAISVKGWNYRLIVSLLRFLPMRWLHFAMKHTQVARYGAD